MTEIIAALIIGLIGLLAYSYQEWLKRRTSLAEKKQETHIALVENVFELLGAEDAKKRSDLLSKIEEAWLSASDVVLRKLYGYLEVFDRNYDEGQSMLILIKGKPARRD